MLRESVVEQMSRHRLTHVQSKETIAVDDPNLKAKSEVRRNAHRQPINYLPKSEKITIHETAPKTTPAPADA